MTGLFVSLAVLKNESRQELRFDSSAWNGTAVLRASIENYLPTTFAPLRIFITANT
jgi:hypothetical protein